MHPSTEINLGVIVSETQCTYNTLSHILNTKYFNTYRLVQIYIKILNTAVSAHILLTTSMDLLIYISAELKKSHCNY
jgi:hypothetical protein